MTSARPSVHESGKILPLLLSLTIGFGVFLGCGKEPELAEKSKNLIIISIDTTRADHFGCYDPSSVGTTPRIDEFAKGGVILENAYTPAPITLPAHASLLTGKYPPTHGIRDNGIFVLDQENETLAEILSKAGYATGGFVGSKILDRRYGLGQGFDLYDQVPLRIEGENDNREIASQRTAGEVFDAAFSWLHQQQTPFFLFAHLYDPHAPYTPPPEFQEKFGTDPQSCYRAEIAYTDDQIGRFIDKVREAGFLEDTIVLITADHGEGLGDKNEVTHGILIYQSTIRIPMILFGSGIPRGVRIAQPVSLVDVLPTALDLLNLSLAESKWTTQVNSHVYGNSFVPVMTKTEGPERAAQRDERPLYIETLLPYYDMGWSTLEGMIRGSDKLIIAPTPELYDIRVDPRETTNLFANDSARTQQNLKTFDSLKTDLLDAAVGDVKPMELEREDKLMLAELGYLDASGILERDQTIDPKEHIEEAELTIALGSKVSEGQYSLAIRDCERVFELNPKNLYAREQYARIHQKLMFESRERGDSKRAHSLALKTIELFGACLELQPDRVEILFSKAMTLNSLKQYDEAKEVFETCVQVQATFAPPHRWLGTLAEMRKDKDSAIRHYEDFLLHWGGEGKIVPFIQERLIQLRSQ